MRILVVGSGAREHALVWKLAGEHGVSDIVCTPGNPGIAGAARCVPGDVADPEGLLRVAEAERVDLTVVGPEAGESSREQYDNVDDYHNYTDTTKRNNDKSLFVRTASVQYRALRNGTPSATGDFAVVKVCVVGPDGRQVALNQLVTCTTPRR